jgi:alcohol dehydrogenase class IV
MVNLAIEKVKEHTAEIMDNLAERAKNDNKASELFLDYVLELSKNLDIRTAPVIVALSKEQKQQLNKLLLDEPDEQEESTKSA